MGLNISRWVNVFDHDYFFENVQICKRLFNNWNPFLSACTIASFVHHILKFEHFRSGDLGIISENGYPERNNSVLALKMLMWHEKITGIKIHHKLRGPEKMIEMPNGNRYFVDGYDEANDTAYEVHGCFYHGCPKCVNPTLEHPKNPGIENKAIYDRTIKREEEIKTEGHKVVSWWEHDINQMLKENLEMRDFFKKVFSKLFSIKNPISVSSCNSPHTKRRNVWRTYSVLSNDC